jgi:hypothetical protein
MSENNGDPVGDFQRWLMKQGAKGMAKQVADKVRSTVGVAPDPKADVWETATTEPLGEEPPECKWCPICRAARAAQGGGSVNDTLSGLVQDAFSVIDTVIRSNNGPVVGTRVPGRTVVHPQDQNGESADESGDRAKGRDPGDGPASSGGDEQVGWPAE